MARWKLLITESTYKEKNSVSPNAGGPVNVYSCPYCGAEKRVPMGTRPKLNVCMNCKREVEPLPEFGGIQWPGS